MTDKSNLKTYVKPGGGEIQVNVANPANLKAAQELGWKPKGSK